MLTSCPDVIAAPRAEDSTKLAATTRVATHSKIRLRIFFSQSPSDPRCHEQIPPRAVSCLLGTGSQRKKAATVVVSGAYSRIYPRISLRESIAVDGRLDSLAKAQARQIVQSLQSHPMPPTLDAIRAAHARIGDAIYHSPCPYSL